MNDAHTKMTSLIGTCFRTLAMSSLSLSTPPSLIVEAAEDFVVACYRESATMEVARSAALTADITSVELEL